MAGVSMSEIRYDSVVCTGCSGLCDDLDIRVDTGKITSIQNICTWGSPKFFGTKKFSDSPRPRIETPMIREAGRLRQADYGEALARAARILKTSQRPWIYGLTAIGCEAQRFALDLARETRGIFEPCESEYLDAFFRALRTQGLYGATLEEVKNEADLVLFWGCNPIHSCPRHLSRYSVFTRGRFTERGFQDRKVIHVDIARNEMEEVTGQFVKVEPGEDHRLMKRLMALAADGGSPSVHRGLSSREKLVDLTQTSRLGAIFAGMGLWASESRKANMDALFGLMKTLNKTGSFVVFPYLDDFNSAGVIHLLLRETGSPRAVDFSKDRRGNLRGPILDRLRRVDAILVLGADLAWLLPREERKRLRDVPMIQVDSFETYTTQLCDVVLPSAMAGIEAEEIAYRMDGLPLKLSRLLDSPHPSDRLILRDLLGKM
jgi:formylmethanofuran dehydrogenase subunit B